MSCSSTVRRPRWGAMAVGTVLDEPPGDTVMLYEVAGSEECPVCRSNLPPFSYCPSCGMPWSDSGKSVETLLSSMRQEAARNIRDPKASGASRLAWYWVAYRRHRPGPADGASSQRIAGRRSMRRCGPSSPPIPMGTMNGGCGLMNKSNTILQITSEVLDRYRNSISRKAFIQAMERVIELVLGPGGAPSAGGVPRPAVDPRAPRWTPSAWRSCSAGRARRFSRQKRTLTAGSLTARPAGSPGWSPESRL